MVKGVGWAAWLCCVLCADITCRGIWGGEMVWSDFHLHPVSSLEEALIKNSQKISKRMDFRIMTKKNTKQKNSVQQLAAEHLGE